MHYFYQKVYSGKATLINTWRMYPHDAKQLWITTEYYILTYSTLLPKGKSFSLIKD